MKTLILLLGMTLACITASAQTDSTKVKDSIVFYHKTVAIKLSNQRRLAVYDREAEAIKLQAQLSMEAVQGKINLVLEMTYEDNGLTKADIEKAEYKGDSISLTLRKKYVPPVAKPKKK